MDRRYTSESNDHRTGWLAFAAIAVVFVSTLWAFPVHSAVVRYVGLEELVDLSDVAVRAEVVRRTSFIRDRDGRIVTHTTLEVRETYFGESDGRIRLEQWGGTVGERTARVPGDATFATGEEVVVFLRRAPDEKAETLFLTALAQSKFSVERSGETPVVSRDLSSLTFEEPETGETFRLEGRVQTLGSLESRLRSLREQAEGRTP